jgi:hypothetical protein
MPSPDGTTNATPEQLAGYVSGTSSPSLNDLCDWSQGHELYVGLGWKVLLLNDAIIMVGVGLIVWFLLRKQKR